MPLYDVRCSAGHEAEVLRPAGTDQVSCPTCGAPASRVFRPGYTVSQRGPSTDVVNLSRRFEEAYSEREATFAREEARTGQPAARPNDMAVVQAHVDAKAHHGEYDLNRRAREIEFKRAGSKR